MSDSKYKVFFWDYHDQPPLKAIIAAARNNPKWKIRFRRGMQK